MAEQGGRSQIARSLVDEGDLGPAQAMGAMVRRVEAAQGEPVVHEAAVMPFRDVFAPAWLRLGNSQSLDREPRFSQAVSASRAGSVISNGTGRPVFC